MVGLRAHREWRDAREPPSLPSPGAPPVATRRSTALLIPDRDGPFAAYEELGVEDPRVTGLEREYVIIYSAYSRNGVRIALAKTKDFSQVERGSLITQADYRNVVILPGKLEGLYARLDRPHGTVKLYWGGADTVMCVGEAHAWRVIVRWPLRPRA